MYAVSAQPAQLPRRAHRALSDRHGSDRSEDPDQDVYKRQVFAVPSTAAGLPFSDVEEESWYYEYVGYVYENGLFSGTSDTTFEPETLMTRAMFVQLMANFDGVDLKAYTETPFEDVEDGSWYESAVAWAAENKVVNGTSEVTFHPGDPITREQMCQLLSSYTAYAEITLTKTAEEKTLSLIHIFCS